MIWYTEFYVRKYTDQLQILLKYVDQILNSQTLTTAAHTGSISMLPP